MALPLSRILELKFRLKYHLNLSFIDFNETDLSELLWMENRLKKQFEDEKKPEKEGHR